MNVMHRDLKLANIMVHFPDLPDDHCTQDIDMRLKHLKNVPLTEKNIVCKIADLGFARKLDEHSLAQTCLGTPL